MNNGLYPHVTVFHGHYKNLTMSNVNGLYRHAVCGNETVTVTLRNQKKYCFLLFSLKYK